MTYLGPMSLGVMVPQHEMDNGFTGAPHQCHRLYFSAEFLAEPALGWTLEIREPLTAELRKGAHHDPVANFRDKLTDADWRANHGDRLEGTMVKCDFGVLRVWRLTGTFFPLTSTCVWEGKWPD